MTFFLTNSLWTFALLLTRSALMMKRSSQVCFFNAVIIIAFIPLALRGITYKPLGAAALL